MEASKAAAPANSTAVGAMLFQASGWIEPDPLPIKSTALVDGVVQEVHVLEGQLVKKGEIIATAELCAVTVERSRLLVLNFSTVAR